MSTHAALPEIPEQLVRRYDAAGPRYTSYPTAPEWRTDFGPQRYAERLAAASRTPAAPLSLYVHLPFCQEMCTYCGCNVVITKDRCKADLYIDHLQREMDLAAPLLGDRRGVMQLHWGGGTPTFLDEGQLQTLFQALTARFQIRPGAELAIEIDPVITTPSQLRLLRQLGFNRLSMGVQDFDPTVQAAVNRIQPADDTHALLNTARELGFSGVNFDLIYGLPHQTEATWTATLERILQMRPDRLAIYSFAYIPEMRPHQKRLPVAALPQGAAKLGLFLTAYRLLVGAGYRAIGMDHFALPEDELGRAQERRALFRNFQGYTVQAAGDVVAFGATGISDVQGAFAQNVRPLGEYYEAVTAGRFATERGMVLSDDDLRRRQVITQLMCNFYADLGADGAFASEVALLKPHMDDGLVRVFEDGGHTFVEVLPLGHFFVRNVAMVFDAYLTRPGERSGRFGHKLTYSKTV